MAPSDCPRQRPDPEQSLELSVSAQRSLKLLQLRLEQFYGIEPSPSILPYVRPSALGSREEVLVRADGGGLALCVLLPQEALEALAHGQAAANFDALLEAVEGVSHYVHLSERARTELPTTLLEIELQAEVDKFAFLATTGRLQHSDVRRLPREDLYDLHHRLFEQVDFIHGSDSVQGARYRLANYLAARLWSRLLHPDSRFPLEETLHRFYRAGQSEKIAIARAA